MPRDPSLGTIGINSQGERQSPMCSVSLSTSQATCRWHKILFQLAWEEHYVTLFLQWALFTSGTTLCSHLEKAMLSCWAGWPLSICFGHTMAPIHALMGSKHQLASHLQQLDLVPRHYFLSASLRAEGERWVWSPLNKQILSINKNKKK